MNQSEQINDLAAALARAQGSITNPERNRTVKVKGTSAKGHDFHYDFKYATLDAIINAVKSPLADNALAYTQILTLDQRGKYVLVTRLIHSSGQWLESVTPLLGIDDARNQEFGSALTYMRRYALTALLGIAADEDDDANAADGNQAEVKKVLVAVNPIPPIPRPGEAVAVKALPQELITQNLPNGNVDWVEWGQRFLGNVKECFPPDREKWLEYNSEKFKSMEKQAPRVYKRLTDALGGINADQKITAG